MPSKDQKPSVGRKATIKPEAMAPVATPRKRTKKAKAKKDNAAKEVAELGKAGGWRSISLAGGPIGQRRVAFSSDSACFFCVAGARIKVHSSATGLVIRSLSATSDLPITYTSIQPHSSESSQVYSASTDGLIRLWNHETGQLLKSWKLGGSLEHLKINQNEPDHAYIIKRDSKATSKDAYTLARYSFSTLKSTVLVKSKEELLGVQIAADNSYVATASAKECSMMSVDFVSQPVIEKFYPDTRITSFALHPTGVYIAIGDLIGKITLWHCGSIFAPGPAITSVMHWHPYQVNGVEFTADGEYLLSGGEEAVLVVWQLTTRSKSFLPRLGSPIQTVAVSPNQQSYALTHADNSVRIVTATTMQSKHLLAGPPAHIHVPDRRWKLAREPRENSVVLYGQLGNIQFYDVSSDARLHQLDVTGVEPAMSLDEHKQVVTNIVTQVQFSEDNKWMMTVDERHDLESTARESRLKFWKYDSDTSRYTLFTRIDRPHAGYVTGATMSPKSSSPLRAATTGSDGVFRVWQWNSDSANGNEDSWQCQSTGSYRNMIPQDVSFSADGSLIAVSYDKAITMWDGAGSVLQSVMMAPTPVRNVEFAGGSGYVVTSSSTHVHVWNLLSGALWWTLRMDVQDIAVDTNSSVFAVITSETFPDPSRPPKIRSRISIFDVSSPTPIVTFARQGKYCAASFLPKSSGSDFVALNDGGELEVFAKQEKRQDATPAKAQASIATDTKLSSIYREAATPSAPTRVESRFLVPKMSGLDAPSHVHPPPTRFFMSTMEQLLTRRATLMEENGMEVEEGVVKQEPVDVIETTEDDARETVRLDSERLSALFTRMLVAA
ncbi:WD repeat-containing protein 75 [Thoreauomyces humboldtii]|nr:WD repeat-containing protein 75 [Thoreauomyces humboldtii]